MKIIKHLFLTVFIAFLGVAGFSSSVYSWSPFGNSQRIQQREKSKAMQDLNHWNHSQQGKLKEACRKHCTSLKCGLHLDIAQCCAQNCPGQLIQNCLKWSKVPKKSLDKKINYCEQLEEPQEEWQRDERAEEEIEEEPEDEE